MTRSPTDAEFTEMVHGLLGLALPHGLPLVGDHGLAEDLVQTALARTYAAWSKVRSVEAGPAYARTMLVTPHRSGSAGGRGACGAERAAWRSCCATTRTCRWLRPPAPSTAPRERSSHRPSMPSPSSAPTWVTPSSP